MPDDSITLKVQLDTSDLEDNLKKSVKSGIKAGTRDGAKELTNEIQISYADALKATTPDLKEVKRAARIMTSLNRSDPETRRQEFASRIKTARARSDTMRLKASMENVKLNREKAKGYNITKRKEARIAVLDKQAELVDKRKKSASDLEKQKTNDKLLVDNKRFTNQQTLISDRESSAIRVSAKRAADRQKDREDKARIKAEEDARRLQHAKDVADYRTQKNIERINLQESLRREREERRQSAVGGIFGSFGSMFESLNPKRMSEAFTGVGDFLKDYNRGLGMKQAGSIVTDPFAVSEGFAAGYTGKGKLGGIAKILGPVIGAVGTIAMLFKKTILDPTLKVGKKVVGYFVDIAKQTETLQALFNLIALPFKIIFTLGFIGPLMAFIPILKEMINWITENKEVIQSISDTLASVFTNIFTPERMGIVTELMDKFAGVLQFLADSLATNMSTVNTENVAAFIATTITSVVGFIQDVLMSIVAFCYSPEGQAFIVSMAEGIGRLIGTLVDILIAMLPIFIEMAAVAIFGIIEGIISTVGKAIGNLFDIIDKATGGALTGFVNGILSIANWFIDRINDAIGFINSINPFGQIGRVGHLDLWNQGNVGSNFGTATTTAYNTHTISNMFTITNNNQLSNSDTMRNLMMTGL